MIEATFEKNGKVTKRPMDGDYWAKYSAALAWLGIVDAGPVASEAEAQRIEARTKAQAERDRIRAQSATSRRNAASR